MNIDEFWKIMDRVHAAAPQDMDAKCRLLDTELRQLSIDEVRSFDEHFSDCWYRAYTWDLWAAAFMICGGCSDDKFMDFRATLISLGSTVFSAAMVDVDSLAAFEIDSAWAKYEGYQYVAPKVFSEMVGRTIPRWKEHPKEPLGVSFDEWDLERRFPNLARKYGHKDSDYELDRSRADKQARKEQTAERIIVIMLEGGIIPPCGLIPPFSVLASVLQTGRSPASTGRDYAWPPLKLDEEQYWSTLVRLEKMSSEERKCRPDLSGMRLRQDVSAGMVATFDAWMQTLKHRRLV